MHNHDTLRRIRSFLIYLDHNYNRPEKRKKEELEKIFKKNIAQSEIYTYCITNRLINYNKTDKNGGFILDLSLEGLEFLNRQKLDDQSEGLLRATWITAMAAALNVFVSLFIFILNFGKEPISSKISLIVLGIIITILTGLLVFYIFKLFPNNHKILPTFFRSHFS